MTESEKNDQEIFADISDVLREFKHCLRIRGLRMTSERELVCREVYSTSFHFDAENLISRIHALSAGVSRATVYRTLDVLQECGLVKKIRQTDTRHHYEKSLGLAHHDHLFCDECGKVIEFREDEIEKLQDDVCLKFGFKPRRHTLQIYGMCRDCLAKETGRQSDIPEEGLESGPG